MSHDARTVTRTRSRAPRGFKMLGDAGEDAVRNAAMQGYALDIYRAEHGDMGAFTANTVEQGGIGGGWARTSPVADEPTFTKDELDIFGKLGTAIIGGGASIGTALLTNPGRQTAPLTYRPAAPAAEKPFSVSSLILPVGIGLGSLVLLKLFKVI